MKQDHTAIKNVDDLQTKIKIGNLLVKKIKKGPIKEVEVFALSRLGARYLLTRSITHIIPPCIIEGWIDELKEFLKDNKELGLNLVESICRKTDRREFNLEQNKIDEIITLYPGNEKLKKLLKEVHRLKEEEEELLFGDTLPIGLEVKD